MFEIRDLYSKAVQFLKEEDEGVIAIESAFVLPGLLLFFLGFMTILSMQNASTSVGKVTYTVADILTQARQLSARTVDCTFLAGKSLMNNTDSNNLQLMMVGIDVNQTANTATVAWSRGTNLKSLVLPAVGADMSSVIPATLISDVSGFVVMAHGRLKHSGYLSNAINEENGYNPFEFEYQNFFIPRVTNGGIPCPDCNTASASAC